MPTDNTLVGDQDDVRELLRLEDAYEEESIYEDSDEDEYTASTESLLQRLISLPSRIEGLEDISMSFQYLMEDGKESTETQRILMESVNSLVLDAKVEELSDTLTSSDGLEGINDFVDSFKKKLKALLSMIMRVLGNIKDYIKNRVKRVRRRYNYLKMTAKSGKLGGKNGVMSYPSSITRLVLSSRISDNPNWIPNNMELGFGLYTSMNVVYKGIQDSVKDLATKNTREDLLSSVAMTIEEIKGKVNATLVSPGKYVSPLYPGNKVCAISTGNTFEDYDFLLLDAAVAMPTVAGKQFAPDRSLVDKIFIKCDTILSEIEKDYASGPDAVNRAFKTSIEKQIAGLDKTSGRDTIAIMAAFSWYAQIQKRTLDKSMRYVLNLVDSGLDFCSASFR